MFSSLIANRSVANLKPVRRSYRRAFTLLEVMVALAVLAIAMTALVTAASKQLQIVDRIRARSFAELVANNALAELQLRNRWPELGSSDGDAQMAGLRFHWQLEVKSTELGEMRRVDIAVALKSPSANGALDPLLRNSIFLTER